MVEAFSFCNVLSRGAEHGLLYGQRGDSPVTSKINVSGGDVHVASREPTIEPIRSGRSATVR